MLFGITGHRPPSLGCSYETPNPIYDKVYSALQKAYEELNVSKIITGMAQGTDQWAAWAAMELGIPFIAALPCDDQDKTWPKSAQNKYKALLKSASEVVVVTPGPYSKGCMHTRDRWVVDNSQSLIAVWTGVFEGGTFATIRHAEKKQKTNLSYLIHIINPNNL